MPFTRTEASYTYSVHLRVLQIVNQRLALAKPKHQAHVYTFSAGAILNIDVLIKTL